MFTTACGTPTDNTTAGVFVSAIGCAATTSTSTTQDYLVTVTGTAQGPVGSVMTPEVGRGAGPTDASKVTDAIDEMFFTGWSFGTGNAITREQGDSPGANVSIEYSVTANTPVTPFAVYAYFQLTPPSGSPQDAQKTTTCQ